MNRIVDFSISNPVLPSKFIDVPRKRMIYAAGDAWGGFDKQNANRGLTNIEAFTKLGFNIFCCKDSPSESDDNLVYLNKHPDLNIVVCILTGINKVDFPILRTLFKNSLEEINTDDTRFYPDSESVFEMLKHGGVSLRVHSRFIIGQTKNTHKAIPWMPFDLGWGEPNFRIIKHERWLYNFVKIGMNYISESDNSIFRNIQEKNNAVYANRLRLENAAAWNINRATRKRGAGRKKTRKNTAKI